MLLEHNGATPKIDPTARIAPNAVLCGEVTIGANSSIGFGAVLTAESGSITVGQQLCHHGYRATVRINGIVHIRTALPPDAVVPLNWIAVGDPVEILPSSVSRGGHPSGKLCPRSCHATRVPFKHIGRIGYCSGLNVEKAEALRL